MEVYKLRHVFVMRGQDNISYGRNMDYLTKKLNGYILLRIRFYIS
jgi:hypothetical protein